MYKKALIFLFVMVSGLSAQDVRSNVEDVRLFRQGASVTRTAALSLKKGENEIIIPGHTPALEDWSVQGGLTGISARILSVKVETYALLEKRNERIRDIEKALEALRSRDREIIDRMSVLTRQRQQAETILKSSGETGALSSKFDSPEKWDQAAAFYLKKVPSLLADERKAESERRKIGTEIQALEYELSQLAGTQYFSNYVQIRDERVKKGAAPSEQSYTSQLSNFHSQNLLLERADNNTETEKRIILKIDSPSDGKAVFRYTYHVRSSGWGMDYDFRTDDKGKAASITLYALIRQNSGEDWNNVNLQLSTGKPSSDLTMPSVYPHYLDIIQYMPAPNVQRNMKKAEMDVQQSAGAPMAEAEEAAPAFSEVDDSGPYVEFTFPGKITVKSGGTEEKKTLAMHNLKLNPEDFRLELHPAQKESAYLKVKLKNETNSPWLSGGAALYYNEQFTGKTSLPSIAPGGSEEVLTAMEERITGRRQLVNRFEDSSGVFGGKRRMKYNYLITAENRLKHEAVVWLYERLPVSRHESIEVKAENFTLTEDIDPEWLKSTEYRQGLRRFRLVMKPGEKKELRYDLSVTYDRDKEIRGLP